MTLPKGKVRSVSIRVPLYKAETDVGEGVSLWGLESEGTGSLALKAISRAAADFGVDKAKIVVFSSGREGSDFVLSCGYEVSEGKDA